MNRPSLATKKSPNGSSRDQANGKRPPLRRRQGNFPCQRGVYVGVKGPNYETQAEYRAFCRFGDVVGMSTIPEVLVARTLGIRVLCLSTITNVARPDASQVVTSDEVVEVAQIAQSKLRQIIQGTLGNFFRGE